MIRILAKNYHFKVAVAILAICLWYTPAQAQKFGYVNTNFILNKMPEYSEAKAEIDKLSQGWQEEIQGMQKDIYSMYSALQAEEVLLTAEMKEERMNSIKKKEDYLKEYQKKVFGFEGLFFLKKKELIKGVSLKKSYGNVTKLIKIPAVWLLSLIIICAYVGYKITDYFSLKK